ncbi:MAG: PadR family transcriptional regulator [Dehalococcoidia bacterium]|nr:PadR family transcriptional regulator [Dehalococcoidia bacterium]
MRYPILALVAAGHAHGYELKQALDQQFAAVWPAINVGQIYTTLSRLERDGLVESEQVTQAHRANKRVYAVTPAGQEALTAWMQEATTRPRLKDEFFLKLVMARGTGVADPEALIERQRRAYLQALRDLDGLSSQLANAHDAAVQVLVEGAALHIQADLKWLDLCEAHLLKEGTDD